MFNSKLDCTSFARFGGCWVWSTAAHEREVFIVVTECVVRVNYSNQVYIALRSVMTSNKCLNGAGE